jgi:hypothetical protein
MVPPSRRPAKAPKPTAAPASSSESVEGEHSTAVAPRRRSARLCKASGETQATSIAEEEPTVSSKAQGKKPAASSASARKSARLRIKEETTEANIKSTSAAAKRKASTLEVSQPVKQVRTKPSIEKPSGKVVVKKQPKPTPPKVRGEFAKKQKAKSYGIDLGISPYPDHTAPSPEQCKEVVEILAKYHGDKIPPKAVPPPSLTRAGCGDVPAVHDALLRTRLSAATTTENAANVLDNLVKVYGVADTGVGKGSINWDAVRKDTKEKLFEAIKTGGLGESKSTDIKATLDRIYSENQERCVQTVANGGQLTEDVC